MIDNIFATISSSTIGLTTFIYYYIALKKMEAKYHNELVREFSIEYFDTAEEIDLDSLTIYPKDE